MFELMVLFGEVAEPLGSGSLPEEVGHWGAEELEMYSLCLVLSHLCFLIYGEVSKQSRVSAATVGGCCF